MQDNNILNKILILFFIIIIPFFCSTKEKKQLHEKLMIKGIGVDYEDQKYSLTLQALDFKNPAGEKQPNIKILKLEGNSVSKALDRIPELTGMNPLFSQNLAIIIGKKASEYGLNNFMGFFNQYHESRLNVKMRLSDTSASEIFNAKFNDKPVTAEVLKLISSESSDVNVLNFNRNLVDELSDPIMPVISIDNNNIACEKISIFADDKSKCILNADESINFKIFQGSSDIGSLDLKNGIVCQIKNSKTKIIPKVDKNLIFFNVKIKIAMELLENNMGINIVNEKKNIENQIKEKMDLDIKNLIKKVLNLKCDPLKFGKILRNKFPNYFKKINNWKNSLPDVNYEINTEIELKP